MPEQRRVFTKEFKEQAVLLTKNSGKSVSQKITFEFNLS